MKQKLKTISKLLTFFLLIIASSCQTENDFVENDSNPKEYKMKRINFEELKNTPKAYSTVQKMQNAQENMKHSRAIYDSINDFIINTDNISVTELGNNQWYTFSVSRTYSTDKKENLVLKLETNGEFTPFLIKYDFTPAECILAENHQIIDNIEQKTTIEKLNQIGLNTSTSRFAPCWLASVPHCTLGNHDSETGFGDCNALDYTTYYSCNGGGSDGGSSSTGDSGSSPDGSGDGNGGGGGAPNSPTNQNETSQEQIVINPVFTLPVETTTPCQQLTNLANPAPDGQNIKNDMDWLRGNTNNPNTNSVEHAVDFKNGIGQDNNMHYTNTQSSSNAQFNVPITTGPLNTGGAHTHPSNGNQMFSYGDLKFLADAYNKATDSHKDQVVLILVCPNDPATNAPVTYAIKVNDFQTLYNQVYAIWDSPDYAVIPSGNQEKDNKAKMDKIHYIQSVKYSQSGGNLEKCFLQQFGGLGFSLHKATDDTMTNWDKLEIGRSIASPTTLTVNKTPCN